MEVFAKEISTSSTKLVVGSHARMRNGSTAGEILSLDKGMAVVQMGNLTVKVPLVDLVSAGEPIVQQRSRSVQATYATQHRPDTQIDIREYTKSDALHMLQQFMDNALLTNVHELRIIHGVGTGVMRKEVRKLLQQYKDVREIWHPAHEQGGDGVTMVKL
jgi:DNA mismatch repair protein MutS2